MATSIADFRRMSECAWKRTKRMLARRLGGRRVPAVYVNINRTGQDAT